MPWYSFIWTDAIIEHLAEHDITPEDFEEVVSNPIDNDVSRSSGRRAVWGWTPDGRWVFAVFDMIDDVTVEPVTCYEVDE